MKFEIGNLLRHEPSKSVWIVTKSEKYTGQFKKKWSAEVEAFCIYSGNSPEFWQPNESDTWLLNHRDTHDKDKIWTVI